MKRLLPSSIAANLVLVVLAGMLPILTLTVYFGLERHRHAIDDAKLTSQRVVEFFAQQQEVETRRIREALQNLAKTREVQEQDIPACTLLFQHAVSANPSYVNFALLSAHGEALASALPFTRQNLADRQEVIAAMATGEFAVGEYAVGRVSGMQILPYAYPVFGRNGNVTAVLIATQRLQDFKRIFELAKLPDDSFIGLVDHQGTRLYRHPSKEETPIGSRISPAVWDAIRNMDRQAVILEKGTEGMRRIFAVRRLRLRPDSEPYLNMIVSIPEAQATAEAERITSVYIAWLVVSLLTATGLAWLVGRHGIHHRVAQLVSVAQRVGSGDLSARSGLVKATGSLGELAAALDEMASALERDITERSRVQEALEMEAHRRNLLMDQSSDGIVVIDQDHKVAECNQRFAQMLGYAHQEVIGLCAWDYEANMSEADIRANFSVFHKIHGVFETRHRRKDGSLLDVEVSLSGADIFGKPLVFGIVRDISGRKRAEAAIAAARQDFEIIFENSQVGILLLRGGRVLSRANQRLADILGYSSPAEMAGMRMRAIHLTEEDFREFGEKHYYRLSEGEQTQIEYQLRRKDGSPNWCSISGKAVNPADLDLGVIWVIDDLSTRKAMEKALVVAKDAAEAANRAKSEFLANMSHELRTPLNGVLGMLQLIKATTLDKEQDEYADMAIQSGRRLTRLLSDILDLSRVEAGRLTLQYEPFSLPELFNAVENMFLPVVRQSGVELRHHIDPRIPGRLLGDPIRLQQVLTNLIGNAFKFAESGHILVEAYPLPPLQQGQSRILFTVADTGPGIPDDKLDTLFSPFTQASQGLKRSHQGAGLGLSICKHLISLMNGNISVDTQVGVGTTVYFCTSLKVPELEETGLRPAGEARPRMQPGLRILLAEDDTVSRLAAVRQLEKAGCRVSTVEDGRQAVDRLRQEGFDAVFMDVQMPVMDGVEATRAIRGGKAGPGNAGIPIIALTAYAMSGDREQFLAAGMDGYLAKPVDMDELARVLNEVIQGRQVH